MEPQTHTLKERWWLCIYVTAIAVVVGFIFRRWLFSEQMLFSHDLVIVGNFFRQFLKTQLFEHGSFPLWNPYTDCGVPFIDAIHGGALYPLTILELCGNIFRTVGYSFMLHFVLASLFAYLAARAIGLGRLGATLSGVAYGLSPCLVSWVAPGHDGKIYVATWFPLVVLFLERTLTRRRFRDCALLGLSYGIVILTPHLQLAYYAALFVAAYTVWRLGVEWAHTRRLKTSLGAGALVACGFVIALTISAVQLLPSWQYLLHDSTRATELRGPEFASRYSLHEEEVFSLLVPEFSGANIKDGPSHYWGRNRFKDNSEVLSPLAFFLAAVASVTAGLRHRFFWCTAAASVLVYAVGATTPLYQYIIAVVPFLDSMEAPSTAMYIFAFCAAMLAGSMVDRFASDDPPKLTRTQVIVSLGVPALVTLGAILITLDGEKFLTTYCLWFRSDILPQGDQIQDKWTTALAYLPSLRRGFWFTTAQLWLGTGFLFAATRSRSRRRILWFVPLAVAVCSALFVQRFVAPLNPDRNYGPVGAVAEIARQDPLARAVEIGVWEGAIHMDYFGVQNVAGSCNREPRWFAEVVGGVGRANINNPRLLNLAGVRYPVVSNRLQAPDLCPTTPLRDTLSRLNAFNVLINECAFPRTFLVNRYLVLPDRKELIDSIILGAEDLRQAVLLEEDPQLTASGDESVSDSARIISYEPNTVTVAVHSGYPRLLVLTDNWSEAWRAYVNGEEKRVFRAYGTFRAVEVPSGDSQVVFRYESVTLRVGGLLSLAGLLIVIAAIVTPWIRARRARFRA